eukprot:753140-Hanusia_phi.AAC.3
MQEDLCIKERRSTLVCNSRTTINSNRIESSTNKSGQQGECKQTGTRRMIVLLQEKTGDTSCTKSTTPTI